MGSGPLNTKWVGGAFNMKNGRRKILWVRFETRERKNLENQISNNTSLGKIGKTISKKKYMLIFC
jgi:hypothetical protein